MLTCGPEPTRIPGGTPLDSPTGVSISCLPKRLGVGGWSEEGEACTPMLSSGEAGGIGL